MEKPNKQDYKPTEINCAEDVAAWEMAYNNKLRMYCECLETKLKNIGDIASVMISLDDFPENMPLYKDSGLWQLRSDDMETVVVQQHVNQSDAEFITACKYLSES